MRGTFAAHRDGGRRTGWLGDPHAKPHEASLLALAAVLTVGTADAAFAARKKHRAVRHDSAQSDTDQRKRDFDRSLGLQYDANGVPILIKGYSSVPKGGAALVRRAERRAAEAPRGSSDPARQRLCSVVVGAAQCRLSAAADAQRADRAALQSAEDQHLQRYG